MAGIGTFQKLVGANNLAPEGAGAGVGAGTGVGLGAGAVGAGAGFLRRVMALLSAVPAPIAEPL
jgi:hypothetical protein